jgi:uncharacterized protein (TIGR02118 family)
MYKIITFAKRKPGITLEEYKKYWRDVHGHMVLKTVPPNVKALIKRYTQCTAAEIPGHPQPYDGVAEFYFDDYESLRAWSKFYFSDEAKALRDDQAKFSDVSSMVTVITEENVIIG